MPDQPAIIGRSGTVTELGQDQPKFEYQEWFDELNPPKFDRIALGFHLTDRVSTISVVGVQADSQRTIYGARLRHEKPEDWARAVLSVAERFGVDVIALERSPFESLIIASILVEAKQNGSKTPRFYTVDLSPGIKWSDRANKIARKALVSPRPAVETPKADQALREAAERKTSEVFASERGKAKHRLDYALKQNSSDEFYGPMRELVSEAALAFDGGSLGLFSASPKDECASLMALEKLVQDRLKAVVRGLSEGQSEERTPVGEVGSPHQVASPCTSSESPEGPPQNCRADSRSSAILYGDPASGPSVANSLETSSVVESHKTLESLSPSSNLDGHASGFVEGDSPPTEQVADTSAQRRAYVDRMLYLLDAKMSSPGADVYLPEYMETARKLLELRCTL